MGMSTSVYGFRPADEKHKAMYKAYAACKEAGIDYYGMPDEIIDYFDGVTPREHEMRFDDLGEAVTKFDDKAHESEGFIVDLTKLPKSITHIAFENSW